MEARVAQPNPSDSPFTLLSTPTRSNHHKPSNNRPSETPHARREGTQARPPRGMISRVRSHFGSGRTRPAANGEEQPTPTATSAATAGSTVPRVPSVEGPAGNPPGRTPSGGAAGAVSVARERPVPPALTQASRKVAYAEQLPSFREVSNSNRPTLFVKKLHLCAFCFDFTEPTRDVQEKEMKRTTLVELVEYVNSGAGRFTEAVSEDVIFMLSSNLFRTLPPSRGGTDGEMFDPDEEEPMLEPAWPHLQVGLVGRSLSF